MNTRKYQVHFLGIAILLTMILSLLYPASTVFADDATPPADTSETVDVSGDQGAPPDEEVASDGEQPSVEDPAIDASTITVDATEEPAIVEAATGEPAVEENTTDKPAVVEAATEEPAATGNATEDPVTAEVSTEEPVTGDPASGEETPVIAQLPEGSNLVVIDEAGQTVPLASQEAAQAIASSDPIWCPDGVDPIANTGGCSDSYSSMTALLTALAANQPTQNGTIWIEKTYNSSTAEPGGTTNITIDGDPNFTTLRNYSLTIQGGWDGPGTNTVDASTPSLFSGDRLRIVDWRNNVTIRNILFDGAIGGPSLEIELDLPGTGSDSNPAYNVLVEDVEARNNRNNRGVHITNDESPGSVTVNNSTFTNNGNISNNNDDGLYILARGNVTLMNVTATGNKNEGVEIHNIFSDSGATVQINGTNDFSGNQGSGLIIRSDGNVSLNEVTADNNGGNGADLDNSTGNGGVTITGYHNSFSNNGLQGLSVVTNGDIELNFATISGNNTASTSLDGAVFSSPGSANVYCSIFENNQGFGLNALNVNGSLTFHGMDGFTDYSYNNSASFVDPDYLCAEPVLGCTDPNALNYDPAANTDDGSCIARVYGCTDPSAFNYDPLANSDDESCVARVYGCTDPNASNFDPLANTDDGSCPSTSNVGGGGGSSIIPVTSSEFSCSSASTELQLEDGDFVTLASLCEYDPALDDVLDTELPGSLPNDVQYSSGLEVTLTKDGTTVESLPNGTNMTVAFKVPSGMEGQTFSILYWDSSKWVEKIVSVENGYVKTTSNITGIFVLVMK